MAVSKFSRIDIHAHLNFAAFVADREAVFGRARGSGTAIINVGTQLDTSRAAVKLADEHPEGVYAIVGLHPIHTSASFHNEKELGTAGSVSGAVGNAAGSVSGGSISKAKGSAPIGFTSCGEAFDIAAYRELLKHPKAVGIGECGLDYYRLDPASLARQKEVFLAQIALANETGKSLMLHIRSSEKSTDAYDDALDLLKAHARVRGDSHFFAGTTAVAQRFLDLGFTLSFTGVITFAKQYAELVEYVPLDMIQAETDCPYVAPVPYRGQRNEPAYVAETVKKIAEIKKLPLETVERALLENARRVWGIEI
jgi:TatD DNase family protein